MVVWRVDEKVLKDQVRQLGYEPLEIVYMGQDPAMYGISGLVYGQSPEDRKRYGVVHFTDWGQHPNPGDRDRGIELYWGHYDLTKKAADEYLRDRTKQMKDAPWVYPENPDAYVHNTGKMRVGYRCPNCGRFNDRGMEIFGEPNIQYIYDCPCGCHYITEETNMGVQLAVPYRQKGYQIIDNFDEYQKRPVDERTFDIINDDTGDRMYNQPYALAKTIFPDAEDLAIKQHSKRNVGGSNVRIIRSTNNKRKGLFR